MASKQPHDPAFLEEYRQRHIGRRLLRVLGAFEEHVHERLRLRGFPDFRAADGTVLRHLELSGTRLTLLAQRARITKQGVAKLIDDLERRGYVERSPDPEDGRAKIIGFTERGRQLLATGDTIVRELEAEWAELLGAEDFESLGNLLATLDRRLR